MALPDWPDDGQVLSARRPWPAAAARTWQYLRQGPAPGREHSRAAIRADLEGPECPHAPALRVPARPVLVQLGEMAGQVHVAAPARTRPGRHPVRFRAARAG